MRQPLPTSPEAALSTWRRYARGGPSDQSLEVALKIKHTPVRVWNTSSVWQRGDGLWMQRAATTRIVDAACALLFRLHFYLGCIGGEGS